MGDTLTHLGNPAPAFEARPPGGRMVKAFRDVSQPTGVERFIAMRTDDDRVTTCMPQFEPDRVVVNAAIHGVDSRAGQEGKSRCRQLRLSVASRLAEP